MGETKIMLQTVPLFSITLSPHMELMGLLRMYLTDDTGAAITLLKNSGTNLKTRKPSYINGWSGLFHWKVIILMFLSTTVQIMSGDKKIVLNAIVNFLTTEVKLLMISRKLSSTK